MGVFKRIKTIAKADMNRFLDSMEDPIAMLNEYSREMEQELIKAQKAISRQVFVENKQASLILETKNVIAKRERQANLAIQYEEEEMAKLAVQEKLIHERQLKVYQQQFELIQGQTKILMEKLQELQEIYRDLQHKKVLLASRANVAQSIKQIQQATDSFQTDAFMRGVARAEEKILLMEAEVHMGNQAFYPVARQEFHNFVNEDELNREIEKLKKVYM